MKKNCSFFGTILVVVTMLVGCAGAPPVIEDAGIVTLEISDTVGAGKGYPAKFYFSPKNYLEGKIIVGGDFWWDQEGPFRIEPSEVNVKEGFIRFMLRTANAGTYNISGRVSFVIDGNIKATKTFSKVVTVR
jgi:hypothetical protein